MAVEERALLDEVAVGAATMAVLARDEGVFRAAVDAFRAYDGESMAKLLERHQLAQHCEVVCHWLRSKEAVVLCLELAGPPPQDERPPDLAEFGLLVGKLTADEGAVRLIVDAVQDRDAGAWKELIARYGVERYSHLLCHWVCTVHYRLVCRVICSPIVIDRPYLGPELQFSGAAVGRLAEDAQALSATAKAVLTGRCETLAPELAGHWTPFCHVLCEWLCSWRCMLVCLRMCRIFPIAVLESPLTEMREFALATDALDKSQLERLTAAVLRDDDDQVQAFVKEWGFERFCVQFCHWVCFLRCRLFCRCVCPPRSSGIFTKIGNYYYDTQVDSHVGGTGLTVGDHRAFYRTLKLNGGLSLVAGAPDIEYRFESIQTDATGDSTGFSWTPVRTNQIAATNIGSFGRLHPLGFWQTKEVWVNNPGTSGWNITPDPDGWIAVPPMFPTAPMVTGTGWRFYPGEQLIRLITTELPGTVTSVDETGVTAGQPGANPLITDAHYGLQMSVRRAGDGTAGLPSGTCEHIAINNTDYDNVSHHPYWKGGLFGATNELAMVSIGIEELRRKPCSTLKNSLSVRFTAAHTHLGAVSVTLEGPIPPLSLTLTGAGPDPARNFYGSAALSPGAFAALPACAYLLKLNVEVLLTDGEGGPGVITDYIAFCKSAGTIPAP